MKKTFCFVAIGVGLCLAGPPGQAAPKSETTLPGSVPGVRIVDLAKLVADIGRENPDKSDVSQSLYDSAAASVHLHVLGYEQTAPLHIHRVTEEATVIVTGAPRVSLAFGRDGKRKTLELAAGPGKLILSPPFTGHEWFNPDLRGMQANLIFAAPPFDGNFYLKAADRRVLKGAEPFIFDTDETLRVFLAAGQPFRIAQLPMRRGKLASVLVRTEATIPAHPTSATLLYVSRGEGALLLGAEHPIRQQLFIEIPPNTLIRTRAKPGAPLVMIAFRPEA